MKSKRRLHSLGLLLHFRAVFKPFESMTNVPTSQKQPPGRRPRVQRPPRLASAGPLEAKLHDKQSEPDYRELRIDKVGVRGLRFPITVPRQGAKCSKHRRHYRHVCRSAQGV
jgi:hypothetical protein